jgi:hypothetical protein
MGEGRCVYRVLVGRPEGKRPLGRPWRRWKHDIKMDLRDIGIDKGDLDSGGSGYCQMAGFCEHSDEPSGFTKKAGYF